MQSPNIATRAIGNFVFEHFLWDDAEQIHCDSWASCKLKRFLGLNLITRSELKRPTNVSWCILFPHYIHAAACASNADNRQASNCRLVSCIVRVCERSVAGSHISHWYGHAITSCVDNDADSIPSRWCRLQISITRHASVAARSSSQLLSFLWMFEMKI